MNTNDEDSIIRSVFDKYSAGGRMRPVQFTKFLTALSKKVPGLRGIEMEQTSAALALFTREPEKGMTFIEFRHWWTTSDKYSFFIGEKATLLRKAYKMYTSYKSSPDGLSFQDFEKMMSKLNLKISSESAFDNMDRNDDGIVSFIEFCEWLKWF